MTETLTAVGISLELSCEDEVCSNLAFPLLNQLKRGRYDMCSVLAIPSSLDEWRDEHRTARKRSDRCERRGYTAGPLARELWEEQIEAINTSSSMRQGRPMSSSYSEPQNFLPLPDYHCPRHAIRTTGVWSIENDLVAYLVMYRAGELALVSQILGHWDYLKDEIMFLLFSRALVREMLGEPGFVVYNRHDSGTDGLRFNKERLGFTESEVEWRE